MFATHYVSDRNPTATGQRYQTACAPKGALTGRGDMRVYNVTTDKARVTCARCKRVMATAAATT
jgi:hypothetical protein